MDSQKLTRALERLWLQSRFTSYFFQSVQTAAEPGIPTLALTVSRERAVLLYNPGFIDRLSIDEVIGLLLHEMLHVALSHDHRAVEGTDPYLRNIAQDMVINSYLISHTSSFFSRQGQYEASVPRVTLPRGLPSVPAAFRSETGNPDPSWEDLYRWLKQQPRDSVWENFDARGPDFAPAAGDLAAADSLRDVLANPLQIPSESLPAQDFSLGEMRGLAFYSKDDDTVPTGLHIFLSPRDLKSLEAQRDRVYALATSDQECRQERAFEEIRGIIRSAAPVDISSWKRQLRSIIDYSSQSSEWVYTYGRFNRRYVTGGFYAPGRNFKEQELLTVAVDVSASMVMKPQEIEAAFGVLEELLGKYRIHLVCIDENLFIPIKKDGAFQSGTDLASPYVYKKGDWKAIRTGSSGTTFFAPLFNEYMRGHREMLLVVTDGQIYDLHKLKKYTPTVWVLPEDRNDPFDPPFGRTVTVRTTAHRGGLS